MNTRKMVIAALFLSLGFILHQIIPGLPLGSMKPDPFLAMMFLAILYVDDFRGTMAIGLAAGILTAMTTTFPMGQIPNIIDKAVTAPVVYLIFHLVRNLKNHTLRLSIVSVLGTLLSGTVFLGSALVLVSLPAPFLALFVGVVLPAVVTNSILVLFMDRVLTRAKISSPQKV